MSETRRWLLAIDTATHTIVVAAGTPEGDVIDSEVFEGRYRHSQELLPALTRLMDRAGLELAGLGGIIVGTGPGAFTGLRVGIATAKTLAHELGCPVVGIATSDVLLAAAAREGATGGITLLMPSGARDRLAISAGSAPVVVRGDEPAPDHGPGTIVAIDLDGRAPDDAIALGRQALRAAAGATARARCLAPFEGRDGRRGTARARLRGGAPRRTGDRAERGSGVVARPPVALRIEPMTLDDIASVHEIERESFSVPWPDDAYRSEIQTNRLASYVVARADDAVVGFAGLWVMVDEAHVTTFAVDPRWRRRGVGERLLLALFDLAATRHAREATLEVRLSNMPARRLYEKYGFRPVGIRPRYYSDNGEDALIMTTDPLGTAQMRDRLARLRAALDGRPVDAGEPPRTYDVDDPAYRG